MQTPPIILASESKTRLSLLQRAGLSVNAQAASIDEASLKASLIADQASPRDIADCLADAKARSVAFSYPDQFVIGADQILVCDETILSKANTPSEAAKTLENLSGKAHQLLSAAVIYHGNQAVWRHVSLAKMTVRPLSDTFIEHYLNQMGDDAFWSVGAYQLEGLGAQLFEKVDGDYYTVLGLPLLPMLDFFRRSGCLKT